MKLSETDKKILEERGYEYLDARYSYAKPGKNIAIHQASGGEFYVHIYNQAYKRGVDFDMETEKVTISYFKTIQELFEVLDILETYKIS